MAEGIQGAMRKAKKACHGWSGTGAERPLSATCFLGETVEEKEEKAMASTAMAAMGDMERRRAVGSTRNYSVSRGEGNEISI